MMKAKKSVTLKIDYFKRAMAYLTSIAILFSLIPSFSAVATTNDDAVSDVSENLVVSDKKIISSNVIGATQEDVSTKNIKTDFLSGSQLVFPKADWDQTVKKNLRLFSDNNEVTKNELSIPNMAALYKRIEIRLDGGLEFPNDSDRFIKGIPYDYSFVYVNWDPYWSSIYNGYEALDIESQKSNSLIYFNYEKNKVIADNLSYEEGDGSVSLGVNTYNTPFDGAIDVSCEITFTRRGLSTPSNLNVMVAHENINVDDYSKVITSLEATNGGGFLSDLSGLYVGSSLKFSVAPGYIPAMCYITDSKGNIAFAGRCENDAFYFDDILLNNAGTYTFNLVVDRVNSLNIDISSTAKHDSNGNYADLTFEKTQKKFIEACTEGHITVGHRVKSDYTFDDYETVKEIPVSDFKLNKSLLSFEDIYNLQWVNFNLSPDKVVVFDGAMYSGNEKINIDVSKLSGSDLVFHYFDSESLASVTDKATLKYVLANNVKDSDYGDSNDNLNISSESDTTDGSFYEDDKFIKVNDGIKLPVIYDGTSSAKIRTNNNPVSDNVLGKRFYSSAYRIMNGKNISHDYKVLNVNGKNYIMYLGINGDDSENIHSELRLSEVVPYQKNILLDAPLKNNSGNKYIVVDGDATGDIEFDAYVKDNKIYAVWVSSASQSSTDTVVKYAVFDTTTEGFDEPACVASDGAGAYKFMPHTTDNISVYAEAVPYSEDDLENRISDYGMHIEDAKVNLGEKLKVFGGNTRIVVASADSDAGADSFYVSDEFSDNPSNADTILYDFAFTEIDGIYYLAYITQQDVIQADDIVTKYRLYLRSFTFGEDGLAWSAPRLIRTVIDSRVNDEQDGEYSKEKMVKNYVDGGFSSLKFASAALGQSIPGGTDEEETFLLFRMNDTVYVVKKEDIAGITASHEYKGTIYPLFTDADKIVDVAIGADASGNLAAAYSVCGTENDGIYLSFYDYNTNSWGKGSVITTADEQGKVGFSNIQLVPGRKKFERNQDIEITSEGDNTVVDQYIEMPDEIYSQVLDDFKEHLRLCGLTETQIEQYFQDSTTVPNWLRDEVYDNPTTYDFVRNAEKKGCYFYDTGDEDEIFIFTQGMVPDTASEEGVYVISSFKGSQYIDDVNINIDSPLTRGETADAEISFINAGQKTIRGSAEHPVRVSLMLNSKGADTEIARWNISENINSGDKVCLSNNVALSRFMYSDFGIAENFYITVEESSELNEDCILYDSRAYKTFYNSPQNQEYIIKNLTSSISHITSEGNPVVHAQFDVYYPLCNDVNIKYYQSFSQEGEDKAWEEKLLSDEDIYISGEKYNPASSQTDSGAISITSDERAVDRKNYYFSEIEYNKMLLEYYSVEPVSFYEKGEYRGQTYWYNSEKYTSAEEALSASGNLLEGFKYDWRESAYCNSSWSSVSEAKTAYSDELKKKYILTAEQYGALENDEALNWKTTSDSEGNYVYACYDSYEKANNAYQNAFICSEKNHVVSKHIDVYIPVENISSGNIGIRFDLLHDNDNMGCVSKIVDISSKIYAPDNISINKGGETYVPIEVRGVNSPEISLSQICEDGENLFESIEFTPYTDDTSDALKGSIGIVSKRVSGSGIIRVTDKKTGASKDISFDITESDNTVINIGDNRLISYENDGWSFASADSWVDGKGEPAYNGDIANASNGASMSFYTTAKKLEFDLVGTISVSSDILSANNGEGTVTLTGTEDASAVAVSFNNPFGKLHKITVTVESDSATMDAVRQTYTPILSAMASVTHKGNKYPLSGDGTTENNRLFSKESTAYVWFDILPQDAEDIPGISSTELFIYDETAKDFVKLTGVQSEKITDNGTYLIKIFFDNGKKIEKQAQVNCFVAPTSLDMATITISSDECEYDGSEKKPGISVTLDGKVIDEKYYTLTYSDNINVGRATITVSAVEDEIYTGFVTKEFAICPKSLKDAVVKVENEDGLYYTGDEVKPAVEVILGGITLSSDDYTVSYENNIKPGKANVTVNGKGNYKDTSQASFDILIEKPATKGEDGYYEIYDAANLFWFAKQVNEVDRTVSAKLMNDINLDGIPWTPIGSTSEDSNNFRGVFDGQNHIIRGLYVEGGRAGLGFFGEVRTGTVKNFTIYGEVVVNTDVNYVGGVIGSACGLNSADHGLERNGAVIQNITSYVNLTAKTHGVGMIGGFVGYANHQTLIENCSWYGTFDAGVYRVDSGAGGFVGKIQEYSSEVTICNCAAYGTIKTGYEKGSYVANGVDSDVIYMGGFLSFSNTGAKTYLENCLFAGKFERGSKLTDQAELAAFGTLNSVNAIRNCYYLGDDGLAAVHSKSPLKVGDVNIGITKITEKRLLSGEVAYLLQEANEVWGQTIGADKYPVIGGEKVLLANGVYYNEISEFAIKANGTDGTKATATLAIPTAGTYTLIFADYDGTKLNNMDFVTVTSESNNTVITVPSEIDITLGKDDKIMLWMDMKNFVTLCDAYIVK